MDKNHSHINSNSENAQTTHATTDKEVFPQYSTMGSENYSVIPELAKLQPLSME